MLPVLTAPQPPSLQAITSTTSQAIYTGYFRRDLKDSDLFHWGEGKISVSKENIAFVGKLAPGPDYKLYLSPEFVETENDFPRLKSRMVRVGDIRTFENFLVTVPNSVNVSDYNTAIIWCESFSQFISAAKYH